MYYNQVVVYPTPAPTFLFWPWIVTLQVIVDGSAWLQCCQSFSVGVALHTSSKQKNGVQQRVEENDAPINTNESPQSSSRPSIEGT